MNDSDTETIRQWRRTVLRNVEKEETPRYRLVLVVQTDGASDTIKIWIPEAAMTPYVCAMLESIDTKHELVQMAEDAGTFVDFLKFHVAVGRYTLDELRADIEQQALLYPELFWWHAPFLAYEAPSLPVTLTRVYTIYTSV